MIVSDINRGLFILDPQLDSPAPLVVFTVDANGAFGANPALPSSACGAYLQALDLTSCEVTNVLQVG